MQDPMEVTRGWQLSDAEYVRLMRTSPGGIDSAPLKVTVNQPLRETPDPLDLTLWNLERETEALIVGLSIGAFHPTKAQRDTLTALIEKQQRAQMLAIEVGV